jgi:ABC-2 type transport system permease protein
VNGYLVFAAKEAKEILRTWRIWVLPAIVLFFSVSGPFLARYTPQIVGAVAGAQLGHLTLPPATYLDSYSGWIKNLSQITLFAIIIIYGGIVSSEVSNGTALLVLTKPLSRVAFVAVKVAVNSAFVAVLLGVGTLVTWAITAAIFGKAPSGPLWSGALVWLVLAIFYLALMTLLSVAIGSAAGAAGAGIGAFALLSVAGIWKPLSNYSPAGLAGHAATLAADTATSSVFWPVLTSLAGSVVLAGIAALAFRRKEL